METNNWKIDWHEGMSVGIPEIDEDHKRFAAQIDDLNWAIIDRMDQDEIQRRLQVILDEVVRHFAHEEKLFKEWHYPDAEFHASKHAQITKSLDGIRDNFASYGMPSEWINVGLQVKEILINHLLTEDMKYAAFYRNSSRAQEKQ